MKPTNPIKPRHVHWARQHDWYLRSGQKDGEPVVIVVMDFKDNDKDKPFERRFTDIDQLVRWAGY